MVGQFKVIDTFVQHWPARGDRPAQNIPTISLLDEGQCPMRQMPRYPLEPEQGEVEKFGGGQLNGKSVNIEIREMSGRGNPTIRGRIVGTVNGK
jgi:hypothetical protein